MLKEPEQEFQTKDMALSAFLLLEGYPFLRCEKVGRGVAAMVFDCDEEFGAAVEEYNSGLARVEPRAFVAKVAWVRGKLRDASSAKS